MLSEMYAWISFGRRGNLIFAIFFCQVNSFCPAFVSYGWQESFRQHRDRP